MKVNKNYCEKYDAPLVEAQHVCTLWIELHKIRGAYICENCPYRRGSKAWKEKHKQHKKGEK
uniref:Uncharacterized protein n=1 Tax=viral metagenome TaxID=1070528 RepID=A0A6H2A1L7_9ZZZZ